MKCKKHKILYTIKNQRNIYINFPETGIFMSNGRWSEISSKISFDPRLRQFFR